MPCMSAASYTGAVNTARNDYLGTEPGASPEHRQVWPAISPQIKCEKARTGFIEVSYRELNGAELRFIPDPANGTTEGTESLITH